MTSDSSKTPPVGPVRGGATSLWRVNFWCRGEIKKTSENDRQLLFLLALDCLHNWRAAAINVRWVCRSSAVIPALLWHFCKKKKVFAQSERYVSMLKIQVKNPQWVALERLVVSCECAPVTQRKEKEREFGRKKNLSEEWKRGFGFLQSASLLAASMHTLQ